MRLIRIFPTLGALALTLAASLSWAGGETFVASPQPEANCGGVKLSSASFKDGDPVHKYGFDGNCTANVLPGSPKYIASFSIHAESSYDTQTKIATEKVEAAINGTGPKMVITSASNCPKDPFIQKGVGCSLVNGSGFVGVPLTEADFPLTRGRTTEAAAKAMTPQPPKPGPKFKTVMIKFEDIMILSPAGSQHYAGAVKFQVMVAKHFADDGIECCELELQNSVGGSWTAFKTVQDTRVVAPKDLNFSHDWFDLAKSSKYRVRARAIKKAAYDDVPWSQWVEFFVSSPSGSVPGEGFQPGYKAAGQAPAGGGTAAAAGGSVNPKENSVAGGSVNPNPGAGGVVIKLDPPVVNCPAGWKRQPGPGIACKPEKAFMACPAGSQYFIQGGPLMGCK